MTGDKLTLDELKKLKSSQKKLRTTGAVLLGVGYVGVFIFALSGQFLIAPLIGVVLTVGAVMLVRSFLHVKYKPVKKYGYLLKQEEKASISNSSSMEIENDLMLSQYAAFYVYKGSKLHKEQYKELLKTLGFNILEAEKLFNFECNTLRKYNKQYLLSENFVKDWVFGLSQPFFLHYPKEKEDILKEQFLTISEICKIIDEAEWHFHNSHETSISDEVWHEIYDWRVRGKGGEFGIKYFEMISAYTGVPIELIGNYSNHEGAFISRKKWR